ncbi:hypothetical protein [Actinoplanes philippinensis]|uniref:hypothetical protein n=1 Tax=Actinoplanes philippinensis TaxID=35752 RepID=UPI00340B7FB5
MIDFDAFREALAEILPKSQHTKIERIVTLLDDDLVYEVDICRSRVGIERITAYGLTIAVDANGDAAAIEFPYGAEVTA